MTQKSVLIIGSYHTLPKHTILPTYLTKPVSLAANHRIGFNLVKAFIAES